MKSEEAVKQQISIHYTELVNADTIEAVKFHQGIIKILSWVLEEEKND
jgi:hypothetical protein